MATIKLSAPVGEKKRITEGPTVKNTKADVELVQKMLKANGYNVGVSGNCDSGTIKAITAYQSGKLKYKNPDGVVDPGGRAFKALLPKYETELKRLASIVYVELKLPNGKKVLVTEDEYNKVKKDVTHRCTVMGKSYRRTYDLNAEIYEEYLSVAMLEKGLLNAVSNAMILKWNGINLPSAGHMTKASSAMNALERALGSGKMEAIQTEYIKAEKAVNNFSDVMMKFLKEYTNSASSLGTVLTFTSAAGFAVVGVLAGPVLVTGAGLTAAQAALVSGGGVAVLQSLSKEIGTHAVGSNKSILNSAGDIIVDGVIGAATGGLSSKIPLGFIDDMAKGVAPKVASKLGSMVTTKAAEKMVKNALSASGQETIKTAIGEALTIVGKMAKSGKAPTEKDFKDAVQNVLFATLSAGLIKNMQGFNAKLSKKTQELITKKIGPDVIAKVTKDKEIAKYVQVKVIKEINTKLGETLGKTGYEAAIGSMTGTESPDKLLKLAETAMANDKAFQKQVEAIVKKHVADAEKKLKK